MQGQEQLPGVMPFLHEGKISGGFDLTGPDMQQVQYNGRVVLVVVADVIKLDVHDVKGDTTAFWSFKGVDAGIIRDESMKLHLGRTLHLDGIEPSGVLVDVPTPGPTLVGQYDDEGAFLGFVDPDTGEVDEGPDYKEAVLDHGEHPGRPDVGHRQNTRVPGAGEVDGGHREHVPSEIRRPGDPILERFLSEAVDA